jgi:hypothetical protein
MPRYPNWQQGAASNTAQCGFESHSGHKFSQITSPARKMSAARETIFFVHSKATVDRARSLSQQGLIDREVARIIGVSIGAVQKWRTGIRWGPETERRHGAGCPRCDGQPVDEPWYAYLLGLYLGDGHISPGGDPAKKVWKLSISCADVWPGLIGECVRAMRAVRPGNKVLTVQRQGCTDVKSYSKHWPCLFPQHGPGREHERKIELAEWQRAIVERYPGDFARGLFHSDGCRGVNRVRRKWGGGERWYEYPRYLFVNKSEDILQLCGAALDQLDVAWRYSKPNTISVARREAVARLDEFVGPKY